MHYMYCKQCILYNIVTSEWSVQNHSGLPVSPLVIRSRPVEPLTVLEASCFAEVAYVDI